MRKILALAAAWAMSAGVATAAYVPYTPPQLSTAGEWLALCETDRKACSDTLFDLIWELGVGEKRWAFCLADETTVEAVTSAAETWLRARPRLHGASFEHGLNQALIGTQRCR